METRERLRSWLRHIKESLEISQTELAARLGIGDGSLSQLLSGRKTMGFDVFIKMHRALGRSANELLDDDPPVPKAHGRPLDPQQVSSVAGAKRRGGASGGAA
jgi:transcriptional regulator with XRE-family HTH domain